jgi:superfamily II DNA or RNA helicase
MKPMELRIYQAEHIKKLVRELKERNIACLFSAVGSGKTTESKIVINEVIKEEVLGIKKVIISSPFMTIARDFETSDEDEIYTCPADSKYNTSSYVIPGNSIKMIEKETTKEMRRVLKATNYHPCSFSHASLAGISKFINDPSTILAHTLFVIDEAHHCFHDDEDEETGNGKGTKLGQVVNTAIEKGAKVLYLTATPYRTEGRKTTPIVDISTCNPVVRTIGQQILEKFSPSVDVEYIHIKGNKKFLKNKLKKDSTIVDGANVTFNRPQKARIYAEYVYKQWIKDGCPKAIIVIPGGESVGSAESIKNYFLKKGFPGNISKIRGRKIPIVFDAVGTSSTDRERILGEIREDKGQNGHKFDLVIGCRRFDEGTDVPSASHVYMIGIPGNVRLFQQRVGRILRNKKSVEGYKEWFGEAWLNKAKAVFFVPLCKKVNALDYQVARQLLHCVFAGESYQTYCDSINFSMELEIAIENHLNDVAGDHEDEINDLIDTLDALKMKDEIGHAERVAKIAVEIKKNPDMTKKEICEKVLEGVTSPSEKLSIQNALIENLDFSKTDIKKMAWNVVKNVSAGNHTRKDPDMVLRPNDNSFAQEMEAEFKKLIEKFGNEKVNFKTDKYVDEVLVNLTGEDLTGWTKECEALWNDEETSNKLTNEYIDFIEKYKREPKQTSKKDSYELRLSIWMANKRQAKKGKGSSTFYPSDENIAIKREIPNLFDTQDDLENALKKLQEVAKEFKKTGKKPSLNTPLGRWIHKMIHLKYNPNPKQGRFYPVLDEEANKLGVSGLFDHQTTIKLNKIKNLISYIQKNGIPSKKDVIYKFYYHTKEEYQNGILSTELKEEIDKSKLRKFFLNIDKEKEDNKKMESLCQFYKINNRLPCITSKNKSEMLLARYLNTRRMLYNKTAKLSHILYQSSLNICKKHKFLFLLEKKK